MKSFSISHYCFHSFSYQERERERVVVGLLLGSLHGATVEEE